MRRLLIQLAAVACLLAAPAAAGAEGLEGETFTSESGTIFGETSVDGCSGDPTQGAQQVAFKSAGRASGPYPGLYKEEGKATTEGGKLVAFQSVFTVYTDTGGIGISGIRSLGSGGSGTAICLIDSLATASIVGHDLAYTVRITGADGTYEYNGTSDVEFDQKGGVAGHFRSSFPAVVIKPKPPPPEPPQTTPGVPVIFVHGLLGARLGCDARGWRNDGVSQFNGELWPGNHYVPSAFSLVGGDPLTWLFISLFGPPLVKLPVPQLGWLKDMALQADGRTDRPGTWCAGRVKPLGLVRDVTLRLAKQKLETVDVYGSGFDYLASTGPAYEYAYDWRKSPEAAIAGLDEKIEAVSRETGAEQVAILAHSMGGLVSRWYIDDPARAAKVARLLTVGTPYWGAPKAWLPLAHGQESPLLTDAMDVLLDNDDLRFMARNLSGLYYLFPSEHYIEAQNGWLGRGRGPSYRVDGTLGMIRTLSSPGGNADLARQALDGHRAVLDGFKTNGVDYRVAVGDGLETLTRVREPAGFFSVLGTDYEFGSGDGTVPILSAQQGVDPGTPLGEHVPITRICGVDHSDLTDVVQMVFFEAFLRRGRPLDSAPPCRAGGTQVIIASPGSGHGDGSGACAAAKPRECGVDARVSAVGSVSIGDAVTRGFVDVVESGRRTVMVVRDDAPVLALSLARGTTIETTPLNGETKGRPRVFGPLRGAVTLTTGDVARLERRGRTVKPRPADHKPPRTTVRARRRGHFVVLTPRARDASGVLATIVSIGRGRPRKWTKPLKLRAQRAHTVRFASVDVFGNQERRHAVR